MVRANAWVRCGVLVLGLVMSLSTPGLSLSLPVGPRVQIRGRALAASESMIEVSAPVETFGVYLLDDNRNVRSPRVVFVYVCVRECARA